MKPNLIAITSSDDHSRRSVRAARGREFRPLGETIDDLEIACDELSDLQVVEIASAPMTFDRLVLDEAIAMAHHDAGGESGDALEGHDRRDLEAAVQHLATAGYVLVRTLLGAPEPATNELDHDDLLHCCEAYRWDVILPCRIRTAAAIFATILGALDPHPVSDAITIYSAAFTTGAGFAVCEFQERARC